MVTVQVVTALTTIGLIIMKKLEGKIPVVTGVSKGIAAEIAKHLAAEGAAVVVNYASSNGKCRHRDNGKDCFQ